jgi:hypothetical protein
MMNDELNEHTAFGIPRRDARFCVSLFVLYVQQLNATLHFLSGKDFFLTLRLFHQKHPNKIIFMETACTCTRPHFPAEFRLRLNRADSLPPFWGGGEVARIRFCHRRRSIGRDALPSGSPHTRSIMNSKISHIPGRKKKKNAANVIHIAVVHRHLCGIIFLPFFTFHMQPSTYEHA